MCKKLLSLLMLVVCLLFAGCMGTFVYQVPVDSPIAKHQYSSTVVTERFKDKRPTVGGTGQMWLACIPLMPYGWGYYNRPEDGKSYLTLSGYKFNPTEQLAQASEMSLRYSGLFRHSYFADGYSQIKPDYIFSGILKSTLYRQKVFTYCLSICGPVFWLLGAPEGWTDNQLEIEFTLKSIKSNKIVWRHTVKNSIDRVQWFYCQGQDVINYVPIMQKCMNEAIINLEEFMKKMPSEHGASELEKGIIYYTNKEYKKAYECIRNAAEQENPVAQYYLGVMYSLGTYKDKNEEKAFIWFMRSAKQGNINSQFAVGNMYDKGNGVEKDPVQSEYWINMALTNRSSKAK